MAKRRHVTADGGEREGQGVGGPGGGDGGRPDYDYFRSRTRGGAPAARDATASGSGDACAHTGTAPNSGARETAGPKGSPTGHRPSGNGRTGPARTGSRRDADEGLHGAGSARGDTGGDDDGALADGDDEEWDALDEEDEGHVRPQHQGASITQTFMIFLFILTVFVIVDPESRKGAGQAMGSILEPLIGFDGRYPVYTLLCASILMVGFSSILRHFFTDWYEQARAQKIMTAFQKEVREARISGNQARVRKLMEIQGEIMQYQSKLLTTQMKTMVFTMIVAISTFTWLFTFMSGLDYAYISLPWASRWSLMDNPYIFPNWILIYSLLSIPTGQLFIRMLKIYEFRPRGRRT